MIGQSVGSDASPLSCFLFRPRKSCKKRRKRSHTNVSNTLVTRSSTPPAQTAHVRFRSRKRVHTRLSEKDRTQRLTRRNTGVSDGGGITTLGAFRTFTNIPGPGIRKVYFAAFEPWPEALSKNAESLRNSDALMRVAVPRRRGPAGLRDLFRFCRNRDLYIRRSWFSACARHGWYHYPRTVSHVSETLRGRVSERRTLPLWDLGREVLSKNAESLRDSDALMRVAVPRRRGPAGLRDLFRFCRNCGLYALRSGPFRVCEARGGIATLSALYVLLKRRTAACQNGSFAVF